MEREIFSIKRKALRLNLDRSIYGTLAEIGGGQEVARSFFQAGGASGTVAKSISAYDKTFSDSFYKKGKTEIERYVSEIRLEQMLEKEFGELYLLLNEKRENNRKLFVFANTVETINFKKDNQGHGWLGAKYELFPGAEPNLVVIHTNLFENDTLLQQYTLGSLGVNLIYACYNFYKDPNTFLQSLMDNLSTDRIEIDMARMKGPQLDYVDNRLLSVQLVKNNMTGATMFDEHGNVQQPSEMLYNKNVLALRGSFRPVTYVGVDMLRASYHIFKKDRNYEKGNTIALCEITINNLLTKGKIDERDYLDRVKILNEIGQNVMVSNIQEYYKLVEFFSRINYRKLRIIIGVLTFMDVLDKKYYENLKGGIFEALGKLFIKDMKMYVYPALQENSDTLLNSKNIKLPDDINHLYQFLISNRKIIDIEDVNKEKLHIFSREVYSLLQKGNEKWKTMVPKHIANIIIDQKLFGYNE